MYAPWRRQLLRREVRGRWLDLGAGDGWALREVENGIGIETGPGPVELPYGHGEFDTVWCSHVLQFVPDVLGTLYEARRVLRPGGRLIVTVPLVRPRIPDPLDRQVRFFTPRSLGRALRAAGFAPRVRLRAGTLIAVAERP